MAPQTRRTLGLLLLCLFAATAHGEGRGERERSVTDAVAVFAIYTRASALAVEHPAENRLIFAAWPHGRIVFSENAKRGGAPYRIGRVDPKRIEATLASAKRSGLFENKLFAEPQFGPDAQTTVIEVKTGDNEVKLESWHELYESGSTANVVATDKGLGSLGDKTRLAALGEASREYLLYRLAWTELRLAAAELVPIESQPTNGLLEFRQRRAIWLAR